VGVEVNGYEEEGIDKLKLEKGDLLGHMGRSDRAPYRTWRSDWLPGAVGPPALDSAAQLCCSELIQD
jgi:hypothetical protein